VYTDYQVKVDEVIKQDAGANLVVGALLTAARPGGAVHFPSGHVTNFLEVGHGHPEINAQYVLFLWRAIPSLPEYEIIIDSGYQLKNGRAYSLDDATSQYDGINANDLLAKVKLAGGAK